MKAFKQMATMWAYMVSFFGKGSEDSLIKDGAMNLTEEQKQQLQTALGPKVNLEKDVVQKMNEELANFKKAATPEADQEILDLRAEALKMLQQNNIDPDAAEDVINNPINATTATEKEILAGLVAASKRQDKKIAALIGKPEPDTPMGFLKKELDSNHSATHLFGSNVAADSFESRNWNQRAAGISTVPTDWASEGKIEIQTLKGDIDAFYRAFPDKVKSLHRDLVGLPEHWKIQRNVDQTAGDGTIVNGELSQARKANWLPKNNQSIQAETRKVFPVHIDIEFAGYELQKIEKNFIGDIYNREGSQPIKWAFVAFLLSELDKQRALEDRISATKGVYVPHPDNPDVPGMAIHRGDGVFIQQWRAYHLENKYKVANIGVPTSDNIVDYITDLIEKNLLEEVKNSPGLYLYLSPSWMRKYKARKRVLYGHDNNYDGKELVEIENYENFKFCPLRDLEGTDYMFITFEDIIRPMENVEGERSMWHMDSLKRELFVFADYKWGCGMTHIGNKVKDTDPEAFKKQSLWTNGLLPFKKDFFARLYDMGTGEIALPYSNITVVPGFSRAITDLTNTYKGQIVRIKGNTGATGTVVSSGNISLSGGTFNLCTGGTLTLVVNADTTLSEVKRTTTPDVLVAENVKFDGTAIDATEGNAFDYTGGEATLTAISNGFEGQNIVINGGAGGALTLVDVAGNIDVGANAVLANASKNITLALVDGVWTEIDRTI